MTVLCDNCSPRKGCTAEKNRTECRFYQPMTNEEWRKTCSAEEFAKFFSKQCADSVADFKVGDMSKWKSENWIKWLKEKHNG